MWNGWWGSFNLRTGSAWDIFITDGLAKVKVWVLTQVCFLLYSNKTSLTHQTSFTKELFVLPYRLKSEMLETQTHTPSLPLMFLRHWQSLYLITMSALTGWPCTSWRNYFKRGHSVCSLCSDMYCTMNPYVLFKFSLFFFLFHVISPQSVWSLCCYVYKHIRDLKLALSPALQSIVSLI